MKKHESLSKEHQMLSQELKECEQDRFTFYNQANNLDKLLSLSWSLEY